MNTAALRNLKTRELAEFNNQLTSVISKEEKRLNKIHFKTLKVLYEFQFISNNFILKFHSYIEFIYFCEHMKRNTIFIGKRQLRVKRINRTNREL